MTDDELAHFLTRAAGVYNDRRSLRLVPALMDEAIREIDAAGLLSARAIGAIVGCDEGHVIRAAGGNRGRPRGKLNPSHISWLGYILSLKALPYPTLLDEMIKTGTSLSTIAMLTNVSEATLYRWRKHG